MSNAMVLDQEFLASAANNMPEFMHVIPFDCLILCGPTQGDKHLELFPPIFVLSA